MSKKFLFNIFLLLFLNLLVKPFYILGIDTEFLERVGQSEYGIYFALLNLSFLLNIFLDVGIVNFNTSYIAKHQHLVSKHFSKIVGIRLLLSFMYILICFFSAMLLGYDSSQMILLIPICVNQILAGFILYLRSNIAGLQMFVKDSIISVLDRLILVIMCSVVLWGNVFNVAITIELFIYLQMAAYAFTALVAFLSIYSKIGLIKPRISYFFSIIILKKSFPYALLILLMSFYYRTDGIMIERMLENGAYEAGVYAQAFRFFEAGNMLAYLFGALLYPMFSNLIGQGKDVKPLLIVSYKLILVGSVIGGLAGYFFREEIMDLRFSSEIETSSKAFGYLMIGFIGVGGTYIFGALLTANGNLKSLNIMAISGAALNVLLNFILIPMYQAVGAAIASMITQLSMAVFQIALVRVKLNITLGMSLIIKSLLFLALSLISIYLLKLWIVNWGIACIAFIGISLLLSVALNILSMNSFKEYLTFSRQIKLK